MVVSPDLDYRESETAGVHVFSQPWPGAVIEAHQVTAVGLVPGEFLPRVRGAPAGLVEVVIDSRILEPSIRNASKPEPARVVHWEGRLMYRSSLQLSGSFTSIGHSSSNTAEGH